MSESSTNNFFLPETKEYFKFLSELNNNGFSDMDQTVRYLQGAFGLHQVKAALIYEEWKNHIKVDTAILASVQSRELKSK